MIALPDLGTYLLALLFVLALIGVAALLAKRFGLARTGAPGDGRRRLTLVDSLALDGKRRLLLIRRDGREHLLLLGAATETVIETDIAAAVGEPPRLAASGDGR